MVIVQIVLVILAIVLVAVALNDHSL